MARGEILLHWDDDDWSASWRVRYQVQEMSSTGADVCGLNRLFYYQPATRSAWQYIYPPTERAWVAGNSLAYTRSYWQRNPFPAVQVGEDARFLWSSDARQLKILDNPAFMIGIIHSENTSPKHTRHQRWQPCALETIQQLIGEDFATSPATEAAYRK